MEQNISTLLYQNSIFEGLTPQQIDEILPCIMGGVKTFGAMECVYERGDKVRDLGIVLKGKLLVESDSAQQRIEPNGMFGEMVVFSTYGVVPHRVVAVEGTQVLFLSGEFFRQQCQKNARCKDAHSEVVANLLRLLSDKAILLNKKIAYLTAPDLKTKIAMYLCELYEVNRVATFNMPLNRDRLADFFAVARPSLSRELINMKNQGIIDFFRSTVTILDIGALYAIARGE